MYYKRGNTYWIDLATTEGRIRQSLKTTDEATARMLHDTVVTKHQLARVGATSRTLKEAANIWLKNRRHSRYCLSIEKQADFWLQSLGDLNLDQINRELVDRTLDSLCTRKGGVPSNALKNRYRALLLSILNETKRDLGWIGNVPELKRYIERKPHRTISSEQMTALMKALPEMHALAAELAFSARLRKSQVYLLTWDRFDFARQLLSIDPKNGIFTKLQAGLTSKLLALKQRGGDNPLVFYPEKPVSAHRWRQGLRAAGITETLTFDALRNLAITDSHEKELA